VQTIGEAGEGFCFDGKVGGLDDLFVPVRIGSRRSLPGMGLFGRTGGFGRGYLLFCIVMGVTGKE
jgi:hypothetical protein